MSEDRPGTYHEVSGSLPENLDRFHELVDRELMARTIAGLKAKGNYDPAQHPDPAQYPPLSVAEHLELLALGEHIARYYRHPSNVDEAVKAGATWQQIAAATDVTEDEARGAYRQWAERQHWLSGQYAGKFGMSDAEYAAALKRAEADR
jgi:hypothetical protein